MSKKEQKITNFKEEEKKEGTFWVKKKQGGAELKKTKEIFWAKNWEKIEYIGHKLTNFLKKVTFWAKKTSWG